MNASPSHPPDSINPMLSRESRDIIDGWVSDWCAELDTRESDRGHVPRPKPLLSRLAALFPWCR